MRLPVSRHGFRAPRPGPRTPRPGCRATLRPAALLVCVWTALGLASAGGSQASEVLTDPPVVNLMSGCQPGVHHQPGGPFAVLVFCEGGLGEHIGVTYYDPLGAPSSERYGPRWRLTDRMWQEEQWAADVTSYAWSPDGCHLYVATSEIYGAGAVFDLDLRSRTATQASPRERRVTAGSQWIGYVIVSLDPKKGELRYGVLESGTRGERTTRVRSLHFTGREPIPSASRPRGRGASLADSILDAIASRGGGAVVEDLYERAPTVYTAVCDSIGHGSAKWLEVAKRIQPGTDAGTAEDLDDAVSFALERHPKEVLRMLGADERAPFQIDAVMEAWINRDCPDLETARSAVERRIAAVSSVTDPALAPTRSLCLESLSRLRADLPNMFPAREH